MRIIRTMFILPFGLSGCGDVLDTGDGGARVVLTGSIMGKQQQVCIEQPPTSITPTQLQNEIDNYLFKAVRWDSGTNIYKEIKSDRSCSYKINPSSIMSWSKFISSGSNQQLADWGSFSAKIDSSGKHSVDVCLRDTQCEDGDILDITLNGSALIRMELFNTDSCVSIPVSSGTNYLGVYAVNGTGFKGNCNYSDNNTGEVTVKGITSQKTQVYTVVGGQSSYGELKIIN